MNKINFFTEVQYKEPPNLPLIYSLAESYLNPFGHKAIVIQGNQIGNSEGAIYDRRKSSLFTTVAKIISYSLFILPLAALAVKAIFRQSHEFHSIDLDIKGKIAVTPEIRDYLQGILPDFLSACNLNPKSPSGEISNTSYRYRFQGLVYKNYSHLDPLIRAKEACLLHDLDRLRIPIQATEIELDGLDGKKYSFLIEQGKLPDRFINASAIDIDRDYHARLERVVAKQLAHFYAYTGLGISGGLRNAPLDEEGNAVLFDLIEEDPRERIFGLIDSTSNLGLISALPSIEHVDAALVIAAKEGIKPRYEESYETIRATRQREIERHRAVREFYQQRGILENPQSLIPEDLLGTDTGRKVIQHMNSLLKTPLDKPIVYRRRIEVSDLQSIEMDWRLEGQTKWVLDQLVCRGIIYDYKDWHKGKDGRVYSFLVQA